MNRRRFLSVSAAFAAFPFGTSAAPHRWQGRALGAQAEIVLHGEGTVAKAALADVERLLIEVERTFSLYDPLSELALLNAQGTARVSDNFLRVFGRSDDLFYATDGLFDPTVQSLWRALFQGQSASRDTVGWSQIKLHGSRIELAPGQALTFNGIAQGYATELVAEALRARGFDQVLVNIGEFSGRGRAWKIGVSDPTFGHLGTRTLTGGAIATSSPGAMQVGGQEHILHPKSGATHWSTASVEAGSATLADGLSTALCLASESQVRNILARFPDVRRTTLVDHDGNIRTL